MASNYPGSLDSFDTIASDKKTSDSVGGRTHRQMHNDLGDAIEAVQAELGTDPAGSYSTVKARLDALVAYSAKTGAYTATTADNLLNVTSGTFTLDLPAASTCAGKALRVKNSGTGVVTLDGNSSETVEGVATFPLGPGSYVEIASTGSAWILTGGVPDTGWRDVASLFTAPGGSTIGYLYMRRVGETVMTYLRYLNGSGATGVHTLTGTVPTGFTPNANLPVFGFPGRDESGAVPKSLGYYSSTFYVRNDDTSGNWGYVSCTWPAVAAWPTSLPGSAV